MRTAVRSSFPVVLKLLETLFKSLMIQSIPSRPLHPIEPKLSSVRKIVQH